MLQILTGFGFLSGMSYPFRLLGVFKSHSRLLSYIIVPILLNFVIAIFLDVGLFLFGWELTQVLTDTIIQRLDLFLVNLPSWLGGLDYLIVVLGFLLRIIFGILLLVLTGFLLVQFGVILGAPWYGKLSEELEKITTGNVQVIEVGFMGDIWRAILFEIKKLVLIISLGFLLFFLNVLPGFGTLLSPMGGMILTGTILCLDFFDAPLERRRLKFREKLGIIWKSLPASAGFSLVCLFLIAIPFVNLLTIPFCVGGGTLFVCDRILQKGLLPSENQSFIPQ
ncbi:EI24 domain-containing protein [Crocosphaera sp. UHCC 0190]|uniref:EI24 domain-containing protein n=1 Tax=Crocosphaera sp. UHCC 0190 TaxID=3110246 RepID=UPI002B1F8696|nr:EI24 domain-containing protein [Crocosphaera sp. UHCC 0190]MEA5509496.1 EI24 domain-containing protein [Crocosphaera sp. UHCC 0190]